MTPGRGSKCTATPGNPGNGGLIACPETRHASRSLVAKRYALTGHLRLRLACLLSCR